MDNKQRDNFKLIGSIIDFFKRNIILRIIIIYSAITVAINISFYPIIPVLLNYPPNNEYVSGKLGTSNLLQYIVITSITVILGIILFARALKGINKWKELDPNKPEDVKKIEAIQRKCINLPYLVLIGQAFIINIPLIPIIFLVVTLNKITYLVLYKILAMVFSFYFLAAVVSHIFSKRIFSGILIKTSNVNKIGTRINLRKKIFIQIIPIFLIGMLFTALIGYSRLIEEKGTLTYTIYSTQLKDIVEKSSKIENENDAFKILEKMNFMEPKPIYFIQKPDKEIITSDASKLSGYLEYFTSDPYEGERMFDIMAETQGLVVSAEGKDGTWKLGVVFKVASKNVAVFFVVGFISLLILNILVLYYFSKTLAGDISQVAENLNEIAEGESVDLDKKIPVTSNDEIGDLVVAFNKILDREKEHIKEIEENQSIIAEQERLATLGHLIGGIAHNLRTPIMSISGGIEGLKDLIKEYEESIDDDNVTKQDHHEIAKEMLVWIDKMRPYCSYMSDIMTAVKGQTVQSSDDGHVSFTLDELVKRIDILMNHELKKHHCKLNMEINADMNTTIKGEISTLVQVFNNLIINAIDAYKGSGGEIELKAVRNNKYIEFTIKDFGSGIYKDVQEKLFKEMVTTKGAKGTGLGLYMSFSNIKARFGGKMWFESEEGKGTTFHISIPVA